MSKSFQTNRPIDQLVSNVNSDLDSDFEPVSFPTRIEQIKLKRNSLHSNLSKFIKQPKNAVFIAAVILLTFAFCLYISRKILTKNQNDPKNQTPARKFLLSQKARNLSILSSSLATFGFCVAYCLSRKQPLTVRI